MIFLARAAAAKRTQGSANIKLTVKDNIKQFSKKLTKFEKTQMPFAIEIGINSTLFGLKIEGLLIHIYYLIVVEGPQ